MRSRIFLKFAALLLALCQLAAIVSGCFPITSGVASAVGSAISRAAEQLSEARQESASEESSQPDSGEPGLSEGSGAEGTVNPLFWEVSSDDYSGRVHLFGSIHAARPEAYPLPGHIMSAFENAQALAVECDTIAFAEDQDRQMTALRSLAYLDGTTISSHLSAENYKAAVALLRSLGIYAPQYDYYKPVLWTSLLDSYIVSQAGLSYNSGIDDFFTRLAKASGKELLEIESVEYQYDMLGSFSDRLQEIMLEDYLYDGVIEDQAESLKRLYASWEDGELSGLLSEDGETQSQEDSEYYEEYVQKMLTDRNLRMVDAAESYIKRGMDVFIVVGSAHMLGDSGMVKLLRERGYTVTEHEDRY